MILLLEKWIHRISFCRSSDSAKYGTGSSTVCRPASNGGGSSGLREVRCGMAVAVGRPPAAPSRPRASVHGSQRSLLSVASEGRATSRRVPNLYPPLHTDSSYSLFVSGLCFLTVYRALTALISRLRLIYQLFGKTCIRFLLRLLFLEALIAHCCASYKVN